MKKEFINLGMQPIANGYLAHNADFTEETFFELAMARDEETGLCTLTDIVDIEKVYDDTYVYHSSGSETMRSHFCDIAQRIKAKSNTKSILEIGSNDGAFLKWFDTDVADSVEPCGNFAQLTQDMGYKTLPNFWNMETAKELNRKYDVIYSANCICHIPDLDETFNSAREILTDHGTLVFEDPSLLQMIERTSYDQIYVEHVHMFSVYALKNILESCGLTITRVEHLTVHGGSNRIYAQKSEYAVPDDTVAKALAEEERAGIFTNEATDAFGERVVASKERLLEMLTEFKAQGKKVTSYGSTAKSVTVFNYCGIGPDLIDYITDITPAKQNKLMPGVHIPVISPEEGMNDSVDIAFLGAWNFKEEIMKKETEFLARGGRFVSHVPHPQVCVAIHS
jgi:methylation protein EvaC